MDGQFHCISSPYLLVSHIPVYRDSEGQLWTDEGWQKDLALHLNYLKNFTLVAPVTGVATESIAERRLQRLPPSLGVVALPAQAGWGTAVKTFRDVYRLIDTAVSKADIVHIGVVGWPYPVGWIGAWRALARGRKLVLVVESAPWRNWDGAIGRLSSVVYERAARFFATRADLLIATQPHYLAELRGNRSVGRAEVQFASWVDPDAIAGEGEATGRWDTRLADPGRPLRLLFAGRLVAEKGVLLLKEAARALPPNVQVDVVGEGPLRDQITSPLRLVPTVPYGEPFFDLLRQYDAVVVPSLSDEQPRVVFDAWSQGVAVVAADTDGLRACVKDGETGTLFRAGSVAALVQALSTLSRTRAAEMGLAGLRQAPEHTHENMHRRRSAMFHEVFAARRRVP